MIYVGCNPKGVEVTHLPLYKCGEDVNKKYQWYTSKSHNSLKNANAEWLHIFVCSGGCVR